MKVLYILNSTPRLSGSFKAFMIMLRGLMDKGIKPILVVPKDVEQDYEPILREMGLPIILMRYKYHGYPHWHTIWQKMLFLPRLLARFYVNYLAECRLVRLLQKENIALVHTNIGLIDLGRRVAKRLGVPHIQHIREYGERQFPSRASFVNHMQEPGSYSICITRGVQQYFQLTNIPSSHVIYDGVHAQVNKMSSDSKQSYFLFVGIVHLSKGIDQVIDAYSLYASTLDNPLPLLVAGRIADGGLYAGLRKQLCVNGLIEKVQFMGARSDVESLMRKATAVIVASPVEGFGLCMPEAMFNGTLVIGRNVSGTREQMDNGLELTGQEIALRYETTEQLAERLRQVDKGFPDAEAMRQRALEVVNKLYSNEVHVAHVYGFYQEITKHK